MLRVFANIIIAVIALWTLAAAMAAMLDITVYFPWVVPNTGEIPQHRLANSGGSFNDIRLFWIFTFIWQEHSALPYQLFDNVFVLPRWRDDSFL